MWQRTKGKIDVFVYYKNKDYELQNISENSKPEDVLNMYKAEGCRLIIDGR
jgi:hypothetical protein